MEFSNQSSIPVLIVGAGPVGLALALTLQQEQIPFRIIDRLARGANTSRAAVVHAQTLNALNKINVAHLLIKDGLQLAEFCVRDRDKVLLKINFSNLPTDFSYVLMIPQDRTEAILETELNRRGHFVERGKTFQQYEMTQDGDVCALFADAEGTTETLTAKYLVGADGMKSGVRERSKISFAGSTYEQGFMLADVRMDWPLSQKEVSLFFDPAGMAVVAPLPNGSYRIVAPLDNAPAQPQVADVQTLLVQRSLREGIKVHEVIWGTHFRVHHRLVERAVDGRILLIGDAAHVHSPAGGQGMNTGIQDGVTLGFAVAKVIKSSAGPEELMEWQKARLNVASDVLTLADRLTKMATLKNPMARRGRNLILRVLNFFPSFRFALAMRLSELKNKL